MVMSVFTMAACQTPCPAPDANANPVAMLYRCDDGSILQVTFMRNPNNATVMQEGYAPATLSARSTGLGFRYADGGTELVGRRSEVHWVRPGAAETICRERP